MLAISPSRIAALCFASLAGWLAACSTPAPPSASEAAPADKARVVEALEQRIQGLQREAMRLQDASAIRRLQRAYGYYVDTADWDQVADLFAEDGSIEIGLDGVYSGKERVRAYLRTLGHGHRGLEIGQLNEHIQLQPVVDVAGDGQSARGRWRAFIMAGQYGHNALWGEGTYENEYVKDRGVWKIRRLHWYQTFLVPYEGGWLRNPDVNRGVFVSTQLPPDSPPTERYSTWPGVYIPPYHYPNPGRAAPHTAPAPVPRSSDPELAQLGAAVAELSRRVERLEDEEQIERLVSIYGYYLDKQQWDDLADLFATNGSMEISQRGIYVGRPSIRRALELFGPQNIEPAHLHNHIQYQPVIHVTADGTRAFTRSRALSQIGTFQRSAIWGDGVYENEYVKEDGVWRIAKDHVYTTFFASYEGGWLNAAGRSPKASEKIPPDRPPSEVYESYPEVYIPPFDYPNPVTGAPIDVSRRAEP